MTAKNASRIAWISFVAKWAALASAVGLLAGLASVIFLAALDWAGATRDSHRWLIWLLPIAGFVVGWVYLKVGRSVEPGNNLLIDEIHDPRQVVPFRMAPLILVGTVVSHLFGASVGREGTAVQMGGALADQLTRLFELGNDDRRLLLMAGISAGFASVFGTPLAGAVFGLEVLAIGRMRFDGLLPCLVAAVVGEQTVALVGVWLGVQHTHYDAGLIPSLSAGSLVAAALAGVVFGLVGRVFALATHGLGAAMKALFAYAPLRPMLGGIVFACLIVTLGAWRYVGLGIPVISESFVQPMAPWEFLAKMALTVLSLGSGFKGGEVTPLFYIGATLGNALSPLLNQPLGLMAAIGFVGVFAGAANTPLACTLMAMELFGAPIGVFAAIACTISYLFSSHRGIYRAQRVHRSKLGRRRR